MIARVLWWLVELAVLLAVGLLAAEVLAWALDRPVVHWSQREQRCVRVESDQGFTCDTVPRIHDRVTVQ